MATVEQSWAWGGKPRKFCQFCGMKVPWVAIVCPHCTREIDTVEQIRERQLAYSRQERVRMAIGLALLAIVVLFVLLAKLR